MQKFSVDTCDHILHSADCCREVASLLRNEMTSHDFMDDQESLHIAGMFADEHFADQLGELVIFHSKVVLIDYEDVEEPSEDSTICELTAMARISSFVVMNEIVEEDRFFMDGSLPDLFIVGNFYDRGSSPAYRLWIPAQHLQSALFLGISPLECN